MQIGKTKAKPRSAVDSIKAAASTSPPAAEAISDAVLTAFWTVSEMYPVQVPLVRHKAAHSADPVGQVFQQTGPPLS